MLKYKNFIIVPILAVILIYGTVIYADESSKDFVIIVNKANDVSTLSKSQISRMFLKKTFNWENGSEIQPIDLNARNDIRKAFTQKVHGRNLHSIKNYWQQMIFAGRSVPPLEKATEKQIIDFVSSNPDSIGYVSPKSDLKDVKIVEVTY